MVSEPQELLELLTPEGEPTGISRTRAEVHQDGDWHRSFHLWIVKEERYVLLQRRSAQKDLEPGKVDVSVGGHYRMGETLEEVVREAEEEIGLFVRPEKLHFLGSQRAERFYPQMTDREFQETYVLCCDQPLERYHLDCREVTVLYEVPLEGLIRFCREGGHLAVAGYDCQQRANHALLIPDDLIEQARGDMAYTLEAIQAWLGAPKR